MRVPGRSASAWAGLALAALLSAALLITGGCATREGPAPASGAAPPGFPARDYERAIAEGKAVYRVDPARSTVVIEVRRAGSLARLGHDHVVAGYDIRGYVMPDSDRADLYVALDALVVDEPKLRAEAGFDTAPTADAIAGTRRNMRSRVLDTGRFPFAVISVGALDAERVAPVSITLHGITRTMRVPLQVDAKADEWLVTGAFALNQTDFGIVPLSLLGGAIEVQDAVAIRFRIRAVRR
jgi:polyisoprenoid-binding protein YceI